MLARKLVFLLLAVAAGRANAQFPLSKEKAAAASRAIDGDIQGEKLDCLIDHVKPFLDFAFRFEAGYVVRCPVKLFDGQAAHLVIHTRVTPASGEPVLFGEEYATPGIPTDMRARTNIRHLNSYFEMSGGFTLGEGDYSVDLLVVDSFDRLTRSHWKLKAARAHGEQDIQVTMRTLTAAPLASRPWDGKLVEKGQGFRLTVLLDAAPREASALRLRAWDRVFLLDSVASLLRQIPCESVRVVAFNLDQQREIFRDDHFDRAGFRRLSRSLRELELGTVSYSVLKTQQGWADLLANMTNMEVNAENPSDAVIFLGPVTRIMQKVPPSNLTPARNNSPRFFDLEYIPYWRAGSEFPDAIHHVTVSRNGTILKVHSPAELARGIQRMLEQLRPARDQSPASGWKPPI
jgi:hypothetical protein